MDVREKPILFSTSMVQAILAGRKTQTRRVVKDKLLQSNKDEFEEEFLLATMAKCPYGKVGDVLWVRETWQWDWNFQTIPKEKIYFYKASMSDDVLATGKKWKSPRFMTKDACRIWLRITNVRVERLQDISGQDAISEGITMPAPGPASLLESWGVAKKLFHSIWQSINGEQSWNENPYVWVIEFERIF